MSCAPSENLGKRPNITYAIQTTAPQAATFHTQRAHASIVHATRTKAFDVRLELLDLSLQTLTMRPVFGRIDRLPFQRCVFSP